MKVQKNHSVSPTVRDTRKNVSRVWFFSVSAHQKVVSPRHIIPHIFIFLIVISIIFTIVMNTTSNPWYDTHWGGDTGEETYQEPPQEDPPIIDTDLCCGNTILIFGVVFTAVGVKGYEYFKK